LGSLTEGGETQVNQKKADDRYAVFLLLSLKVTPSSSVKPLRLELHLNRPLSFLVVGLQLQTQANKVSTHTSKPEIYLNNACHKS
jgi:hypothetical protein